MGKRYKSLSESDKEFIKNQHIFFIASASNNGEVNLSPRGYDVFRIIGDNEVIFLDYAGSGNRTARDIEANGEVTIMFTSFSEKPLILKLFCKGELIDKDDVNSRKFFENMNFDGIRRFIKLNIYCVENSCGMSVPYFEYKSEREDLREWCIKKDKNKTLEEYMQNNHIPPNLEEFRKKN